MALVGLNPVGDQSFGTSLLLDSSLDSISPIKDAGQQNYALAAMVTDHHLLDGRESVMSADSGSASQALQAQLKFEMAETEERIEQARLRKQKAKLELLVAKSASGSHRSRTARSILGGRPLFPESSDSLERDLSMMIGEHELREQAERSMIQRAKDEAVAVERLKHQQFEQQAYVELQAERQSNIRQMELAEKAQLVSLQNEYFASEIQRKSLMEQAQMNLEAAAAQREQVLLDQYTSMIQAALVDGDARLMQAEAIVGNEANRLHELRVGELISEQASTNRAQLIEVEQTAEARHATILAAERLRNEEAMPEAVQAERARVERQALEIMNAERHQMRQALDAELRSMQVEMQQQFNREREEGMTRIATLTGEIAQLTKNESEIAAQAHFAAQALAESRNKELRAAAAARDAMMQVNYQQAQKDKAAKGFQWTNPIIPPAPPQTPSFSDPYKPKDPNLQMPKLTQTARSTTTTTRVTPPIQSGGGNPGREASPPPPSGGGGGSNRPPPSPGGGSARRSPSPGGSGGGRGDKPGKEKKKQPPMPDPGDGDEDDSDDDSSSSSDSDEGDLKDDLARKAKLQKLIKRSKSRVKEADHIKVTALPRVDQIRAFKNMIRGEVTSCSGRGDAAFMWIMECENKGATFDGLRKSGRKFESLDCKLASALQKSCNNTPLSQEITQITESEAMAGRNIKGRQILFLIYQFYKSDEQAGQLFSILDLSKVIWRGDKNLHKFIVTWDGVVTGMKTVIPDDQKEVIILEQLRKSTVLQHDIATYDRTPQGEPQRSYKFLYDSVKNYLTRTRQENNRLEQSRCLLRETAAPAQQKGKGDKGGNSRGRSRERSQNGRKGSRSRSKSGDGICKFFAAGKCKKGRDCTYKHERNKSGGGNSDKRGNSPRGNRSKSPNKLTREQMKQSPCAHFAKGDCSFGDKCWYSHTATAAPATGSGGGNATDAQAKTKSKHKKKSKAKATAAAVPAVMKAMIVAAHMLGISTACPALTKSVTALDQHMPIYNVCAAPQMTQFDQYNDECWEKLHFRGHCVRFDGATIYRYPSNCKGPFYTINSGHDLNYRHSERVRNLDRKKCEQQAVDKAFLLCQELNLTNKCYGISAAALYKTKGPAKWLIDTGSGWDLVSRDDICKSVKPSKSAYEIVLHTANGEITIDRKVDLQVGKLRENIEPLLLDNSPPVLSVWRRCMEHGYSFIWKAGQAPYMIRPDNKVVKLTVENYIPWLIERDGEALACPANIIPPAINIAREDSVSQGEAAGAQAPVVEEPKVDEPKMNKIDKQKLEANSLEHLMTHFPKNPFCTACQRAKMQTHQTPNRAKELYRNDPPTYFGENVTADHLIANNVDDWGQAGETAAVVVYDRGTGWLDAFPCETKHPTSLIKH